MSADPNSWREHRPTPSQRLHEVTMAALARRAAEPEHTSEMTRNAKGAWQGTFAVRGYDADATYEKAKELAQRFETDFPYNGAA